MVGVYNLDFYNLPLKHCRWRAHLKVAPPENYHARHYDREEKVGIS